MTRIALAQYGAVAFDTAATVEKAVAVIAEAAAEGAELIVFPEAFLGTYPKALSFGSPVGRRTEEGRDDFLRSWNAAVELEGPELALVADAAREHGIFVVMGIVERAGRTLYCTVAMIDQHGAPAGHHRKVMPTGSERLIWGLGDGSTLPVVDSPAGRLGSVICWENYMPLLRTAMYGQGVEIYCAPTADDRESWLHTMHHVALEGRCWVLTTCQVMRRSDYPDDYAALFGTDPDDILMRGGSAVISPTGELVAGPLYDAEGLLYAEVDREEIIRQSLDFDAVGHYSRPDIFTLTTDTTPKRPVT
ncbi:carbon-nitrogen hydrolase family protein [Streptomyces profundus]|uniref:carbon-nitrogen hydrolase family protein n=1 Tax=Streptomyces profundus TaxID=2867410 RepID=UPI001D160AAA|nr:carbon-nitrogen hydrolase family protein [Streptomyces sp. MA3_2.13]UED84499.1 carbon-nitrogen hydrolase family protein [Streptomyces sp. MA3_2.13]